MFHLDQSMISLLDNTSNHEQLLQMRRSPPTFLPKVWSDTTSVACPPPKKWILRKTFRTTHHARLPQVSEHKHSRWGLDRLPTVDVRTSTLPAVSNTKMESSEETFDEEILSRESRVIISSEVNFFMYRILCVHVQCI